MMRFAVCALFCLCCSFLNNLLAYPVYAQEAKAGLQKKWKAETRNLTLGLSAINLKQFEYIMGANSIIESVVYTRDLMQKGVESCIQHNPELADDMLQNFSVFVADIQPALSSAGKMRRRMMATQNFTSFSRIQNYIKLTNDLALVDQKQVPLVPVSRKKDCKKLLHDIKNEKKRAEIKDLLVNGLGLDERLQPVGEES